MKKSILLPVLIASVLYLGGCFNRVDPLNTVLFFESNPNISLVSQDGDVLNGEGVSTFHSTDVGTSTTLEYSILNSGGVDLKISGLSLSGLHTTQFILNTEKTSSIVRPSTKTQFSVSFKPTHDGLKSATMTIVSNDPDEGNYSFTLNGYGHASGFLPEISVDQGGAFIPDKGTFSGYSDTEVGASEIVEFTIENTGTADLDIFDIFASGTNKDQFGVVAPSIPCTLKASSPPGGPGETTTFSVAFSPTSTGPKSATVNILSNDPDHESYTFTVQGTALPGKPIIVVRNESTVFTNGADNHYFGIVVIGNEKTATFTIENGGTVDLQVTGIQLSGVNNLEFRIDRPTPTFPLLGPKESFTFDVAYKPTATGPARATVEIDNTDTSPNPFTFMVEGLGFAQSSPITDINVVNVSTGDDIPAGSLAHDFGAVVIDKKKGVTLRIENVGTSTLDIDNIGFLAGDTTDFLHDFGSPLSIPAGGSTEFDMNFSPKTTGDKTVTVEIVNNDPLKPSYLFEAIGVGIEKIEPDISIVQLGTVFPNGSSFAFGPVLVGLPRSKVFVIQNTGTDTLVVEDMLFLTGDVTDFLHDIASFPFSISAGALKTFTITFTPSKTGSLYTRLQIIHNDPDSNPYKLRLEGTGSN
jgi:hypothetical protein